MKLGRITPILRIFDEAKAREFYVDFLGFTVDWQHRFGDNFPLYLRCLATAASFTCQSTTATAHPAPQFASRW
jgi:catechol 2,3-dioxygenase-like lactoylglutathione lyase family enzyme